MRVATTAYPEPLALVRSRAADYLELTKPRVLVLVLFTVAAGALLAAGTVPDGWLLVDHCWVDLAEVQRLLDDALAPAVSRVFPVDGERELVAYVATAQAPEDLHTRCLAALPGRHAAMTPRWYVTCASAPADPTRLAGWQAMEVLSAGSGRGSSGAAPRHDAHGTPLTETVTGGVGVSDEVP